MPPTAEEITQRLVQLEARQARIEESLYSIQALVTDINKQRTSSPNQETKKKIKEPPEYDGKDKDFATTFISHLNLYFSVYEEAYNRDEDKIRYAVSYLRGLAFRWYEPYLGKNCKDESMQINYQYFCDELVKNLGEPDRQATLTRQLRNLRQITTAADYAAEFNRISTYLPWNDASLREQFYINLKDDVKDRLAGIVDLPVDLQDYIKLVIQIDNRLQERKTERQRPRRYVEEFRPTFTTQRKPQGSRDSVTPMELDGTTTNGPPKKLTNAERQHRKDNDLCMYCGTKEHTLPNCRHRSRNIHATETFTLMGPSTSAES